MQYLMIDKKDTILDLAKIVGQKNIDLLLSENNLPRTPKIGKAWNDKATNIIATSTEEVTASRKSALLNNLVDNDEVFEKACLMDEDEWKLFSATQCFKDAIKVPESIVLPYSVKIIGGIGLGALIGNARRVGSQSQSTQSLVEQSSQSSSSSPVSPVTYRAVMEGLKDSPIISPAIFNTVNTAPGLTVTTTLQQENNVPPVAFNLPWGKIQMYSAILKEVVDFPAYPEQLETTRQASYTSMPDIIYQYEPWIVYESSGPRQQSLSFHLHRDMWSGNHLDGQANNLIRFCEANTFPDYSGSAVVAPFVRLYINGSLFIAGVILNTNVEWTGPIGLDGWYLEFTLSLTIQETSDRALNIRTVRDMGLIGS